MGGGQRLSWAPRKVSPSPQSKGVTSIGLFPPIPPALPPLYLPPFSPPLSSSHTSLLRPCPPPPGPSPSPHLTPAHLPQGLRLFPCLSLPPPFPHAQASLVHHHQDGVPAPQPSFQGPSWPGPCGCLASVPSPTFPARALCPYPQLLQPSPSPSPLRGPLAPLSLCALHLQTIAPLFSLWPWVGRAGQGREGQIYVSFFCVCFPDPSGQGLGVRGLTAPCSERQR